MTHSGKISIIFVTWLAALLRWRALFVNRFHTDEALFASLARHIAVWQDPLLQLQPVDKPPLLFYLQAVFYPLFGSVEWAARLPNFVASVLLVPMVGALVWRWYRQEKTAVIATLLIALSPLHIQFSATAFTDPLLTTFIAAALLVIPRRSGWAGIWFGLATATKHQAWLFLPLLVGTAVFQQWSFKTWRRALTAFIPFPVAVAAWEIARTGQFTLWSQQISNFGGLRLIWSWELLPRLQSWVELFQTIFAGSAIISVFLLIWLAFGKPGQNQRYRWEGWTALFIVGYFGLHWLLAVPVWDRYLLPLVPLLAVLAARSIAWLVLRLTEFYAETQKPGGFLSASLRLCVCFLGCVLVILMVHGAWQARNGRYPIGGSPTADQGAAEIAEYLADAPYGTVLYDHWYSWQWRYHLFDKRVFVSWFPHPDALITDLTVFKGEMGDRYLVLPDNDQARPVRRALLDAGFVLETVSTDTESGMILYRILF